MTQYSGSFDDEKEWEEWLDEQDARSMEANFHREADSTPRPWSGWEEYPIHGVFAREKQCHHHQDPFPVRVDDDTFQVYVSSSRATRHTEHQFCPDMHVVLDGAQRPRIIGHYVPWPDMGVPDVSMELLHALLVEVMEAYRLDNLVEIGCIGAHGRTGTFLAMLVVLEDPSLSVDEVIAHVRREHCDKAIETEMQEWYVAAYRAWLKDEVPPPKPEPKKPAYHVTSYGRVPLPASTTLAKQSWRERVQAKRKEWTGKRRH